MPWFRSFILATSAFFSVAAPSVADESLCASIPRDAKLVIVVEDVRALDRGLRAFANAIGEPIGAASTFAGISAAIGMDFEEWESSQTKKLLDRNALDSINGGVALVWAGDDADDWTLIVTTTDPERLLAQLGANEAEDGYSSFSLDGMKRLARADEDVLIIAGSKRVLAEHHVAAKEFEQHAVRDAKEHSKLPQVFLQCDAPPAFLQNEFDSAFGQEGADVADRLVAELFRTHSIVVGLSVGRHGVVTKLRCIAPDRERPAGRQFAPGNPIADLLSGLPAGPFTSAIGCRTGPWLPLLKERIGELLESPRYADDLSLADLDDVQMFLKYCDRVTAYRTSETLTTRIALLETGDPDELARLIRTAGIHERRLLKRLVGLPPDFALRQMMRDEIATPTSDVYVFGIDEMEPFYRNIARAIYGERPRIAVSVSRSALGVATTKQGMFPSAPLPGEPTLLDEPRIRAILSDLPERADLVLLLDPIVLVRDIVEAVGRGAYPPATFLFVAFGIDPSNVDLPDPLPPPCGIALSVDDRGLSIRCVVRSDTVRSGNEWAGDLGSAIGADF